MYEGELPPKVTASDEFPEVLALVLPAFKLATVVQEDPFHVSAAAVTEPVVPLERIPAVNIPAADPASLAVFKLFTSVHELPFQYSVKA